MPRLHFPAMIVRVGTGKGGVAATAQGLFGRLRDHAQGNAKDPVWRAYAERCVIPRLTRPQLDELADYLKSEEKGEKSG